jgi:hypothetical protein
MTRTLTIWTMVALIFGLQFIASLALIGVLRLSASEFMLPLLLLFLGCLFALVFRTLERRGHGSGWKPWLAVLFYAGFIFSLSGNSMTNVSLPFSADYFHPVEYATFALLICLVAFATFRRTGLQWVFFLVLTIGILYALSDEFHQAFVPGRYSSFSDIVLDSAGLLTGCASFLAIRKYVKPIDAPLKPKPDK